MFEIRSARPHDKGSIQEFYISAVGAGTPLDQSFWNQLIEAGGLLVAWNASEIVGLGGIEVNATEQLKWLYIHPRYQGAGLGSAILQRLEAIGWAAGLKALRLHSAPGAVAFYQRHGYHPVAAESQHGHDHKGVEMLKVRDDAR